MSGIFLSDAWPRETKLIPFMINIFEEAPGSCHIGLNNKNMSCSIYRQAVMTNKERYPSFYACSYYYYQ